MADNKAGDVPAEPVVSEVAEEVQAQAQTEVTEEKTPETPVTEPLTNGSSTPESVPEESPAASPLAEAAAAAPAEEPASAPAPVLEPVSTEPAEPEHLPINGLSLEEPKLEIPQVEVIVQKEPEEPTVTESPPAPEISVKKEVCVEQMPLIEPSPPPLPANPPPSSVASFAATTMAPELADASLANTAENSVSAQPIVPDTKNLVSETSLEPKSILTDPQTTSTEIPSSTQISSNEPTPVVLPEVETGHTTEETIKEDACEQPIQEVEIPKVEIDTDKVDVKLDELPITAEEVPDISEAEAVTEPIATESEEIIDLPPPPPALVDDNVDSNFNDAEEKVEAVAPEIQLTNDILLNGNHISETEAVNGFEKEIVVDDVNTEQENLKNKAKDSLGNVAETIECNGNMDDLNTVPQEEISDTPIQEQCLEDAAPLEPPPPAAEPAAAPPQEPVAVSDKMAELIPEIPSVPELPTETLQETTSDVAVAN